MHREVLRAVDAGLVSRDTRQRPHRYAASQGAPAYRPLRELLELTVGVPIRLSAVLERLPDVEAAAIHGSWAAGRVRADSDIDVIVVSDGERRSAEQALREVGRSVAREIDVSLLTREEFARLRSERNPFVGKILHGPRIDLVGDLEALGTGQ